MNEEKRDELIIRIDERVQGLKETDIPEIKAHLINLNSNVAKNTAFRNKMAGALKIFTVVAPLSGGMVAGVLKIFGVY